MVQDLKDGTLKRTGPTKHPFPKFKKAMTLELDDEVDEDDALYVCAEQPDSESSEDELHDDI